MKLEDLKKRARTIRVAWDDPVGRNLATLVCDLVYEIERRDLVIDQHADCIKMLQERKQPSVFSSIFGDF